MENSNGCGCWNHGCGCGHNGNENGGCGCSHGSEHEHNGCNGRNNGTAALSELFENEMSYDYPVYVSIPFFLRRDCDCDRR